MRHLHLTLIDLVYVVSGLTGLFVSLHALPSYHRSVRAAGRVRNESDRHDALRINHGIVTREYVRLSIHILGTIVGFTAAFYVPVARILPPYDHYLGIEIDTILLWANIGTTINTILAWVEYCTIRQRGWFEEEGMLSDFRGRIARAERRTKGDRPARVSRNTIAFLLSQARTAPRRQRKTDLRADASAVTVGDHEERIETVEEKVETRTVVTREKGKGMDDADRL
jgi:hypothetical protein